MRSSQRAANVRYYHLNRQREIERVILRQRATRDLLRKRREQPCQDCGGRFKAHQMDFDHRDPSDKSFRLTSAYGMMATPMALAAEFLKCDVVCANCHRIRTASRDLPAQRRLPDAAASRDLLRRRGYWRTQAQLLTGLKERPCADCGRRLPACAMDFDHRDPEEKHYTVSRMIGRAGTAKIMAEVAKCDIVCANCHRDRTYVRRQAGVAERE